MTITAMITITNCYLSRVAFWNESGKESKNEVGKVGEP